MNKSDETLYQSIAKQSEQLGYRNKLRLAQLLIQLARKEEEQASPEKRDDVSGKKPTEREDIEYVAQRIVRLRPGNKSTLLNAIGAMFQFRGGISDQDKENIVKELIRGKVLTIETGSRVSYTARN